MTVSTPYITSATATGDGRGGHTRSQDGLLDLDLAIPTELGGPGGSFTNPEQLFAAGYAACFHGALQMIARQRKVTVTDSAITVQTTIGGETGFVLRVAVTAALPHLDKHVAEELVEAAHQLCPYSRAIQGNVDVRLAVA